MLDDKNMLDIGFSNGTIEIHGLPPDNELLSASCRWDERSACHRAPASEYANIVVKISKEKIAFTDHARQYQQLQNGSKIHRTPRPFQQQAIHAWLENRAQGIVVLPTGAGKTQVGVMAIDAKRRSTLVIAPTLVLVRQWYDVLRTVFAIPIGVIGGGEYQVEKLTVTTYDSAYMHMEHLGNRFGLVIFDECHHLPGDTYALSARFCLAPYRLGLTATPERSDGRDTDLKELIGPVTYRQDIVDLSGDYLAEYETERIAVELLPDERREYENEREIYLTFLRSQGIRLGSPTDWSKFIIYSSRSPQGRRAMRAYHRQRELAFTAPAKLDYAEHLIHQHRNDRIIVFTDNNETAYMLSRRLLIPAITHQTKITERSEILRNLQQGKYHAVVTSKVLNEGVDVPSANVAIVVSGSGSVREHVQRLGRVLRKQGDKRAILYELITANTSETFTSKRRREHVAYR